MCDFFFREGKNIYVGTKTKHKPKRERREERQMNNAKKINKISATSTRLNYLGAINNSFFFQVSTRSTEWKGRRNKI